MKPILYIFFIVLLVPLGNIYSAYGNTNQPAVAQLLQRSFNNNIKLQRSFNKDLKSNSKTCSNQSHFLSDFTQQFMNHSVYIQRFHVFHIFIKNTRPLNSILCLLNSNSSDLFKKQLIYFTEDLQKNNILSDSQYQSILYYIVTQSTVQKDLKKIAFKKFIHFASQNNNNNFIESILSHPNTFIDLKLLVIKKHLTTNNCTNFIVSLSVNIIKNNNINNSIRDNLMDLLSNSCDTDFYKNQMLYLATKSDLIWYLQFKALKKSFSLNKNTYCSNIPIHYLLTVFEAPHTMWSVRDSIVWLLADVQKDCTQQIISYFSNLIQTDSDNLSFEMTEFRQKKITSLIWILVRLTIRSSQLEGVKALEEISMNHKVNSYFRAQAVLALQSLAIYNNQAAHSLYKIIQNIKITYSKFINDDEIIRIQEDTKIQKFALKLLLELILKTKAEFTSFLVITDSKIDIVQYDRSRAFKALPWPSKINIYAMPVVIKLIQDKTINKQYKEYAKTVLNSLED